MVLRLRKTLSDVHDRVKRLSGGLLDPKPKRHSSFDDDSDSNSNNSSTNNNNNKDYIHFHGVKPRASSSKSKLDDIKIRRRLTVTGCDGHQVTRADNSWYYNDQTETTIDHHGIKTTSFCSSNC